MFRCLPAVLVCLLLATPAWAADYFGRPDAAPGAAAPSAPQGPDGLPVLPQATVALPAPLRAALGGVVAMQSRLNGELRRHLRAARDDRSVRPAAAIVLFSFLYGVFHAIGPGHGKLVVGSYFLTRRARLWHGLSMSLAAALVQAGSAIVLVGGLAALFDIGSRTILDHAAWLESVSYAVIAALGVWMAWGVLSGRVCCDHDGAHHQAHGHAADCDCAHHHGQAPEPGPGSGERLSRRAEWWRVLSTGAAVGLRPCSGAILVLLFTLANGIFAVGVVATFAMALGVALTVAAVSLGTLGLNRWLSRLGRGEHGVAQSARKLAALTGALLITAFGLLQLLAIWMGLIVPMAG